MESGYKMRSIGLKKLDDFLLDCEYISQDEREEIIEFSIKLDKGLE